ncbi:unnamed protein product [Blepharisma stoltei]|uniref:Histidine kinase n=1 Tax=Blepharisma stoltei TaxID=1481888 RepID=A0AAU9JQH5_9CILI|nr:unnamed protein product [Blepharisma stoltei]
MNKDLQFLWWEERVESVYKQFLQFSNFVLAITFIINAFKTYFYPSEFLFQVLFPQTLLHTVITFTMKRFGRRSLSWRVGILIFTTEYCNAFLLYNSWTVDQANLGILELIAFLVTVVFELPIVKNKWILNLLVFKHLYLWHIHGMIFGNTTSKEIASSYNAVILVFAFCNMGYHQVSNASYTRYSYQKELENSKNRLHAITDAFSDGIMIISHHYEIKFYNQCTLELLQTSGERLSSALYNIEYLKGKKVSRFNNSNKLIEDICFLLENHDHVDTTLGVTLIGNTHLEWKAKIIEWENAPSVFLLIRDINQIVNLEASIANDKMKTLLLRTVSHELKTPLNSIIYFTEDLLGNITHLCSEEIEKLKIVSISAQMMLLLVNDLLDYSKILAGIFSIHKSFCSIKDIVENSVSLIRLQATKKGISVISRIDPLLSAGIYTDPLRFKQIIINLLINALKYTVKGKIEICCACCNKYKLKCYIEDTGVGVEEGSIKLLFSRHNSSYIPDIHEQGYGLGLGIANLLVKQLGGKGIKVKSVLDKGSMFYFKIDISQEILETEALESLKNDVGNDNFENLIPELSYFDSFKDVLIVDDMEFNLEILGSILRKYGIGYEEALNGRIAIDKVILQDAKCQPFKVIVMDCEMPEMNGWEATKTIEWLYKEKKIKSLPCIIGYSAYSDEEDAKYSLVCGMQCYLTKPCAPEKIVNTIIKYL